MNRPHVSPCMNRESDENATYRLKILVPEKRRHGLMMFMSSANIIERAETPKPAAGRWQSVQAIGERN